MKRNVFSIVMGTVFEIQYTCKLLLIFHTLDKHEKRKEHIRLLFSTFFHSIEKLATKSLKVKNRWLFFGFKDRVGHMKVLILTKTISRGRSSYEKAH